MHAIRAWITKEKNGYVACWSFPDTVDQPPATYTFSSDEFARAWVYYQANLLGVRVQWLDGGQICTAAPV